MLAGLDLTGDMISYSYFDGKTIETEVLTNTRGFRTKELFTIPGALSGLLRMTKDMIGFSGITISEAICVVPAYCSYAERERIKTAAEECGLKLRFLMRGSLAAALQMYQTMGQEQENVLLGCVYSDYAELLLFQADGDVLTVKGSANLMLRELPTAEQLTKRLQSELKALYTEQEMSFEDRAEKLYLTIDEYAGAAGELFKESLEGCFDGKAEIMENESVRGAMYHLLKLEDVSYDGMRKCYLVDSSMEGISISSGVGGELVEVFRRNRPLPQKNIVDLLASHDNVLCFYSGNFRNREYDVPIGTCRIPDQYRGQMIQVKITLTAEGVVEYVVLDNKKQIIFPRQVLN